MIERHLDQMIIRVEIDGKWESRCLTDCTWEQVEAWIVFKCESTAGDNGKLGLREQVNYHREIVKHLHERLRDLGDQLNVTGKSSE
jgi:hypothetical protein